MAEVLRIRPLGVDMEIAFGNELSKGFQDRIRDLWREVPGGEGEPDVFCRMHIGRSGGRQLNERSGVRLIAEKTEAALIASSTAELTLDAIGQRAGELLMLHASAVALQDGRVVAFVGESGAGKTTIARTLGAKYPYVTDETVAVEQGPTCSVLPFRKPLSIVNPGKPKTQLAPAELGLLPLPSAETSLAAIVFIRRDEQHRGQVNVAPVDLADAITSLVPQLSYLSAMERPLRQIAELLSRLGGASTVTYREAEDLVPFVPEFIGGSAGQDWRDGVTPETQTTTGWNLVGGTEWLETVEGRLLVFTERMLHELGGIAPTIWQALLEADGSLDTEKILAELEARHGSPEDSDARGLVVQALTSLEELGLIRHESSVTKE